MGARGSKTKPNADAPLSRRNSQTQIVAMDPANECEDEVRTPEKTDDRHKAENETHDDHVSKVHEILEGRVELKKHQHQLEHLPKMDLQFSSSEDSDDNTGRRKRKGAKKKRRKSKDESVTTTKPGAPAPSRVRLKLNEIQSPKKRPPATQPAAAVPVKKEYFEQISDAYSLTEYTGKEADDGSPKRQTHEPAHVQQQQPQQQMLSPAKPQQQPSPSSSPSKYFGGAFDNWKKPTLSLRSTRSMIMETRDASRKSPPNHSNPSAKSNSSRGGDRSTNSRHFTNQPVEGYSKIDLWQADIDELERESTSFADSFSSLALRSRSMEIKGADEPRHSATPTAYISTPTPRPKSNRRNLRIDDMDESIMDTILAEVVT